MLRHNCNGHLIAYVPKKDLEEEVVSQKEVPEGKHFTLANGWELVVSNLTDPLALPMTVEARKLN
jgi:nitrogen fixation protein NifT